MSEQTKIMGTNETISNVPVENVLAGKHYDGSPKETTPQEGPVQIVRENSEAGGQLRSPDNLFTIHITCNDLQLKLLLLRELRYFFNDPDRASNTFLPKVKDALQREAQTNQTIPK